MNHITRLAATAGLFLTTLGIAQAQLPLPTAPNAPWWIGDIHLQAAVNAGADGHGVIVEDIDTGMDKSVATTVMSGTTFLPAWTLGPQFDPHYDVIGHGTWTASIISIVAPKALIMPARVFGATEGADTKDIAKAIYWGIAHHAQVINMSLGGPTDDAVLAKAVKAAANANILVFCADGNDGSPTISYPAANPGCHGISATGPDHALTSFSQYGPGTFLAAPGSYVGGYLPYHVNKIGGIGYTTASGTSASTPVVSGAAAALLSLGYTPQQVLEALAITANHPPTYSKNGMGAGLIDLGKAITWLEVYYGPLCHRCGLVRR